MIKKVSECDRVHYYISPEEYIDINKILKEKGTTIKQVCIDENVSYTQMCAVLNGKTGIGSKYLFIIKKYTGLRLR